MNSAIKARVFWGLELALIICIVFIVLLPYSPSDHSLPSRDSGVFLYTGWRVLHGEVPYLHVWDHKPPVIYYLDAFGLWLTPDSIWGVWLVEVFLLILAGLIGYSLLSRLYGLFPAIFITFLWLFSAFYLLAGGNLTTEYALPFQFSTLWFFYRSENSPRYGWNGLFLGATSSLLFFTRQNAIAIPIAIGIYLLINRIKNQEIQRLINDALMILAGALMVIGVVVGYFAFKGALPAFWDTAFLYNFAYAEERDAVDRIYALTQGLNQLENLGLAQIALIGWCGALPLTIFKKERIQPEFRSLIWMTLCAMPLELWMVSLGGRPRIPYFLVLLPIFSVFAGFTLWLIFESLLKDIPRYVGAMITVLLVISLGSVFYSDYTEMVANFMQPSGDSKITSYIQNNSAPDDFVLMWGAESTYNFVARRVSPTRFVYQTPLYNEKDKDSVTEFLQGILINKPRLIVLRSEDKLSDFRFGYRDNQIGGLMDQVKMLYENSAIVGNWVVYNYSGQ
jgi:4-amino-4-deoxy-L-arabinose transferase-like glycosyltransferase